LSDKPECIIFSKFTVPYLLPYLLHRVSRITTKVHKVIGMNVNVLSNIIIGCAIEVHRQLGPGLLESAYQECLLYELKLAGLYVRKEKPMPIVYKEVKLDHGYRIDLLVEEKVVIEIKTVEALTVVHFARVLTYLKLGNYKLGLLLNFHVSVLKHGIKRIIN
jgi:GxxExxY protein